MKGSDLDERTEVISLFAAMQRERAPLEQLLERVDAHWGYEDGVYRFYHQSFKVYDLQELTSEMVSALSALAPERALHEWFLQIVREGTGKRFEIAHNARWLEETRPIVEAFLHARYFLAMVVKYARELDAPPNVLPSGWASVLYLYGLR
jgi:hypothetical protein